MSATLAGSKRTFPMPDVRPLLLCEPREPIPLRYSISFACPSPITRSHRGKAKKDGAGLGKRDPGGMGVEKDRETRGGGEEGQGRETDREEGTRDLGSDDTAQIMRITRGQPPRVSFLRSQQRPPSSFSTGTCCATCFRSRVIIKKRHRDFQRPRASFSLCSRVHVCA